MTTFPYSRPNVALRLLSSPLLIMANVVKAAWYEMVFNVTDLRDNGTSAVRYILTGNPEKGAVREAVVARKDAVSAAVTAKAVSTRKGLKSFWRNQLEERLIALSLLIALPLLTVAAAVVALFQSEVFRDIWGIVTSLVRTVITGDRRDFTWL